MILDLHCFGFPAFFQFKEKIIFQSPPAENLPPPGGEDLQDSLRERRARETMQRNEAARRRLREELDNEEQQRTEMIERTLNLMNRSDPRFISLSEQIRRLSLDPESILRNRFTRDIVYLRFQPHGADQVTEEAIYLLRQEILVASLLRSINRQIPPLSPLYERANRIGIPGDVLESILRERAEEYTMMLSRTEDDVSKDAKDNIVEESVVRIQAAIDDFLRRINNIFGNSLVRGYFQRFRPELLDMTAEILLVRSDTGDIRAGIARYIADRGNRTQYGITWENIEDLIREYHPPGFR